MPDIAPLPLPVAGAFRMAFSGPGGLRAVAGGMRGGGGCGAGSWCAGQEGGIPPSQRILTVSTKRAQPEGGQWPASPEWGTCVEAEIEVKAEPEVKVKAEPESKVIRLRVRLRIKRGL